MDKFFRLGIYTIDKMVFDGKVSSLSAPAETGYLGILLNHAPLMTKLKTGKITFKSEDGGLNTINSGSSGFLEVLNNKVSILLDSVDE